jgi:hypothetical protein
VEQPLFHVLLQGRKVGPYDRRTLIGMRIKNTLTSDHVLLDGGGAELTVGDLIGRTRSNDSNPARSGGASVVQATYTGSLAAVEGKGANIPPFRGELEIRVQGDVLRIAGRFRRGLGWKEDRVKLVLKDIVHARASGSQVDLWLRVAPGHGPVRVTLELFSLDSATQLVGWLPAASPPPVGVTTGLRTAPAAHALWVAIGSAVVVVGIVLAVLVRRLY